MTRPNPNATPLRTCDNTRQQTFRRANQLLEAAKRVSDCHHLQYVEFHGQYAEDGYLDPESGVIAVGDWNEYAGATIMPRLSRALDRLGIPCEWCDEWADCYECGGLVRVRPDSYCWQPSYIEDDGALVCKECVDPEKVLRDLEGRSSRCLTLDNIHPEDHGYVRGCEEDYEHGFYGGQNDSPEAIGQDLKSQGIKRFLFRLESQGQFDVDFSVWVHESEAHLLTKEPVGKTDIDPAEGLKLALQAASRATSELKGEGIRYATCDSSTGTAKARLVSPEEFIQGIKP